MHKGLSVPVVSRPVASIRSGVALARSQKNAAQWHFLNVRAQPTETLPACHSGLDPESP
jgi:hypothetical protein